MSNLHLKSTFASNSREVLGITPQQAGWLHAGLRVLRLAEKDHVELETGQHEIAVVPLSGSCAVTVDGCRYDLEGRAHVFASLTDWAYVPVGSSLCLDSNDGCEIALASSRASKRFNPMHMKAADVPVETRGRAGATRQVNNFMTPEAFPMADRLICVEVITPDGNWSSYPPHCHDDSAGSPVELEEIYYFRIGQTGLEGYSREGSGFHRTYTADGLVDELVEVKDGDAFLVPRGYHGPCAAAPGYPMYYLNVLAGPGERSLKVVDDVAHAWIREEWQAWSVDPRCPMTSAGHGRGRQMAVSHEGGRD